MTPIPAHTVKLSPPRAPVRTTQPQPTLGPIFFERVGGGSSWGESKGVVNQAAQNPTGRRAQAVLGRAAEGTHAELRRVAAVVQDQLSWDLSLLKSSLADSGTAGRRGDSALNVSPHVGLTRATLTALMPSNARP